MTINKELFRKNDEVQLTYHDKVRVGVVEDVKDTSVCVLLDPNTDPDPAVKYKSFRYDKIQLVNRIVTKG